MLAGIEDTEKQGGLEVRSPVFGVAAGDRLHR